MPLKKRDCPLEIELIPIGDGWTHIYLTAGGERLFFISEYNQFSYLAKALYFFSPKQNDHDQAYDIIEEKVIKVYLDSEKSIVDMEVPYRTEFSWDEGGCDSSLWLLEQEPNYESDFTVKLHIEIQREEYHKEYDFEFLYKDLCYAVAKAYTKGLKEYGFFGYRFSTYYEDVNVNHLLYLKAVALDCPEIRELSTHPSGNGEVTNFNDELELLLFDM